MRIYSGGGKGIAELGAGNGIASKLDYSSTIYF